MVVMTLNFLKPMLRRSSYLRSVVHSIARWFNTVVFLRMALRHATRTLFSSQGTISIFFLNEQKVGNARAKAQFCQLISRRKDY